MERYNLKPLEEKYQMKITWKVAAMFVHVNRIERGIKNVANAIYLFVMTMQKQLLFVQIEFFNLLN